MTVIFMNDDRISKYYDATLAMKEGYFNVELPIEPEKDDISKLGEALVILGSSLEKQFNEMEKLSKVTEEINAGLLLDEVLNHLYDSFRSIIPYDRIGVSLLVDNNKTVRARWARSEAQKMKITPGFSAKLAGSSLNQIIETGQPRIINDLREYFKLHPDSVSTKLILEEGIRSSLTCPLIALNKPIGFIFFASMTPKTYKDVHVDFFLKIASQLSTIVEKSRLYQQLVELNELKNKFLGIAAHDLRNPLGVVKGYLGLLMSGKLDNSMTTDVMQRMDKSCETMLNLINDLLDISAIESGRLNLQLEEVNLYEYLAECHVSNRMLAKPKLIELNIELAPNLPSVTLDKERINQVLNNLITNAIKFSFSETVITMKADRKGDELLISVADQGQGIPETEMHKIFGEFNRASVRPTAGEKSTGLGLSIVKRMVEAHQGRIWVESQLEKGSTFTFTLPIQADIKTEA
jgi:signal transduction histidine kinase